VEVEKMKKYAVIGMMALSMMAITACGNKDNTKSNNTVSQDNPSDSSTPDDTPDTPTDDTTNNTEPDNTEPTDNNNTDDPSQTEPQDTQDPDNAADDQADDNNSSSDEKDDGKTFRTEQGLIELGEDPEIELNENGCFNGTYKGDDGCTYKFKKKGTLTIKSEEETLEYTYMLQDNVLYLQAADGSMGTSRYLTLLEDGTYLLDDNNGGQVILTYVK